VKDVKDVKEDLWSSLKKNKNIKACNLLFFFIKVRISSFTSFTLTHEKTQKTFKEIL